MRRPNQVTTRVSRCRWMRRTRRMVCNSFTENPQMQCPPRRVEDEETARGEGRNGLGAEFPLVVRLLDRRLEEAQSSAAYDQVHIWLHARRGPVGIEHC